MKRILWDVDTQVDFMEPSGKLYVPGANAADLTIVAVGSDGALAVLGKVPTARGAHCVTADDLGNVYVCDPDHGRLLTFRDPFPASR